MTSMEDFEIVYVVTEYRTAALTNISTSGILGVYSDVDAALSRAQASQYEALVWGWPTDGGEPIAVS